MRLRKLHLYPALLTAVVGFAPLQAQEKPLDSPAIASAEKAQPPRLVPSANAFLEGLSAEQKTKASMEFGSEKRLGWHFIPKAERKGLPLTEMDESQKKNAMELLRSAVSQLGYTKATQIMQLESVLRQLEGESGSNERNPEKYYFTLFGTPAQGERWGLSFEGHHLSLNFVMQGGKILDSTPQFFATNPAKLPSDFGDGFPKGLQVLKAEEQLGFKLVNSLSEEQLASALLPGDTPTEIRAAGEPQPPTAAARGIAAADLEAEQQETLKKLLQTYTSKMRPVVAKERWSLIDEAGYDNVKFAWSGAKKPGRGHYYIVQGPTFLVEFINVQPDAAGNPANHIHCVWRDMQGDFDLPIASQ